MSFFSNLQLFRFFWILCLSKSFHGTSLLLLYFCQFSFQLCIFSLNLLFLCAFLFLWVTFNFVLGTCNFLVIFIQFTRYFFPTVILRRITKWIFINRRLLGFLQFSQILLLSIFDWFSVELYNCSFDVLDLFFAESIFKGSFEIICKNGLNFNLIIYLFLNLPWLHFLSSTWHTDLIQIWRSFLWNNWFFLLFLMNFHIL